ncbi:MAG: hypothetical protein ABWY20_04725 [Mycobacterium sp.]
MSATSRWLRFRRCRLRLALRRRESIAPQCVNYRLTDLGKPWYLRRRSTRELVAQQAMGVLEETVGGIGNPWR